MRQFIDLGLSPVIVQAIEKLGFEDPTPIQREAIPFLLANQKDITALAQTGTGKTAAFGLPLLEKVDSSRSNTQGLILVPTRELGQQVSQQLKQFAAFAKQVNIEVVYGGASIEQQIRALRKAPHIIIATPGRLIDLINRRKVDLTQVNYVVLDEADEMLNMGFKEDIDTILETTPENKNTWLFSATMSTGIRRIASNYLNNPHEIKIDAQETVNEGITHAFVETNRETRVDIIKNILMIESEAGGILFCRTKAESEEVGQELQNAGIKSEVLHGGFTQAHRDKVMKKFREKKIQLLVATDVAARGIDVKDIGYVFNFGIPDNVEFYTHRSGRTARAGSKGTSIVFIGRRDRSKLKNLARRLRIDFEQFQMPDVNKVVEEKLVNWIEELQKKSEKAEKRIPADIINDVTKKLNHFSREQLISMLIDSDFGKLYKALDQIKKIEEKRCSEEINGKREGRGRNDRNDRSDRSDRSERSRNSSQPSRGDRNYPRYFINLGKMDSMNKKDLAMFISQQAGIPQRDLVSIDIFRTHSYFSVNKKFTDRIASSMRGIEVNGRKLRVNPDNV
ncbi:DEAD/DEAH box helicase [Marinigracilibium pacificum]|uniref:DEAD-box ATP-dependent RNA helicase RhpA n=1 Tax=Marinigracilibium pacificum TaxID=2729599 RepID=A0A848J2M5_9BACT|nr:DEAD/DEAH box helicase [Marinigracilibium pacificum]NMM50026.1 DEAD/DEAH box helicase [Marinigracilibium pacificum]